VKAIDSVPYHDTAETLVDILRQRTQNNNPQFFRVLVSYHLAKIASMMRVKIATKERGVIPVNLYAINLASSGCDKGHSTSILEEHITNEFRTTYYEQTYPLVVEENLAKLATKRAYVKDADPDEMLASVTKEFECLGPLPFSFNSGTTPAVKQTRHQLLMAGIGSMCLEIDEIGSNLLGNADVLTTMLELFDVGKIKQKLTKNTKENQRSEEIDGKTPTNLNLFGTPAKLLDGSKVEQEFYSFLETGYARRCFFGYTRTAIKDLTLTPEQVYDSLTDPKSLKQVTDISTRFGQLANIVNYDKVITVSKDVSLLLIEYRMACERLSASMGEHEDEILKAEIAHRYFKALKLAGAYAFIDGDSEITEDNMYSAIKMAEESGKALNNVLKRDRNYVKLAKYIASIGHEVTHVDLTEDLPFYRGAVAHKNELIQHAITWGYKNHIIIKKSFNSGIEFLRGETLQATDLEKMRLAYSNDIATGYKNVIAPFTKLHQLTQKDNLHWINHYTEDGHRKDENIIPGFNMIVLDIDDGTSIDTIKNLMQDYTCMIHTTKRHTPAYHRFRIVLPTNYFLELDGPDFKEFMVNIFDWLPFDVDRATGQRARKWLTHNGHYEYLMGGKLLDALEFIPKTAKNDERKKAIMDSQSLSNLERWFVTNASNGNRNNQLLRYALMLVDTGMDFNGIRDSVLSLNSKLTNRLEKAEIDSTILVTVSKALAKAATV
jgi:hypothetical protein